MILFCLAWACPIGEEAGAGVEGALGGGCSTLLTRAFFLGHSQLLCIELKEIVEARALREGPDLDSLVSPTTVPPRRVRALTPEDPKRGEAIPCKM